MRILSKKALREEKGIGYSDVHIARLVKASKFPAPIQLGAGRKGWIESEIDIWLEARPRVAWASKSQPPGPSEEVAPTSALSATD
jgi:prophage regulatory protein